MGLIYNVRHYHWHIRTRSHIKPKELHYCVKGLMTAGISLDDAVALRRISMTLHRWHEAECNGEIQRDEATNIPYWYNRHTNKKIWKVADRETGALKRLNKIMAKYPLLSAYVQGDPRGASLYIIRPNDVPEGKDVEAYYNRGLAVYQ